MGQTLQLLCLVLTDQVSYTIIIMIWYIYYVITGGLAVDWMNDKIYFSFGDPGSNLVNPNHLAIYDITTSGYTEITPATIVAYRVYHDLAVDPLGQ